MTKEKSVCVVGCSGFVGSHVTAELLRRGYTVHGTLRDPASEQSAWLRGDVANAAQDHGKDGGRLELFAAEARDKESLKAAMEDTSGVIMCAGVERQEPETIAIMRALGLYVCELALELGIARAVFTSSTGSTNPPGDEPREKREMEHWSSITRQLLDGKYSPAAKTLLDRLVLEQAERSGGTLRCATINPSLITGPCYQSEPVGSLRMFAAILRGERMADSVPNGSMSVIDVRDLANLHIAALENEEASGRYFGVKRSWLWKDILAAIEGAVPGYSMPAIDAAVVPVRPTTFDLSRQASLGVEIRDLDGIVEGAIGELKRRDMI